MEITSNMSNDVVDINILQNYIDGMKISQIGPKFSTYIFAEKLGNQVISMKSMSNNIIDINML